MKSLLDFGIALHDIAHLQKSKRAQRNQHRGGRSRPALRPLTQEHRNMVTEMLGLNLDGLESVFDLHIAGGIGAENSRLIGKFFEHGEAQIVDGLSNIHRSLGASKKG